MSKKHVSRLVSALLAIMMLSSYFCSLNVATFAAEQKSNGGFSVKLNWNGEINSTNLEWNPTTNTSKVLRLNVSYDNTNAETEEYQPDELTITVNGIGDTGRDGKFTKAASIAADEKSSTNKSYDWSYEYNAATDVYTFYNNNYIDSKTNFSGSFEILWSLQARNVVNGHAFEFTADLHGDGYTVTSNTVKFSFTSVGDLFALQESAEPLSNPQGLGNHEIVLDDYVWVRYNINKSQTTRSRGVRSSYHEVYIGEDVLLRQAFTQQNEKVSFKSIGDGWYKVNTGKNFYIIVGYPKSIYLADEETAVVTSYSKYIGTYYDESNSAVLATAETTINLNDYGFTGSLFSKETDSQIFEYTEIFNNKVVNFFYSGVELTTGYVNEIGDDFLDVLLNNGEFRQLEPEEYGFSSVYVPSLADFEAYDTGEAPADPFAFEVWGLMIGEDDYIKLVDAQVGSESYWLDLPEGVYRIKHVVTGVTQNLLAKDSAFSFNVKLHLNDDSELEEGLRVAENGYIRNISYDNRHEPGVDHRPGSEDNYTGTYAQRNMDRDMETYGHLWCRALADVVYRGNLNSISTTISMNEFTDENRNYRTTIAIASTLKTTSKNTDSNFVSKFSQYTILPTGLSVDPDDFNFKTSLNTSSMLLQDGTIINKTASYIKRHVSVDIIENYRDSGRTYVAFHYDFSDNPVNISATHKFTVSFDVLLDGESYLEFGGTYTVHGVTMVEESTSVFEGETRTGSDDGSFINEDESLWMDLDNDNNTDEQITYHSATRTIVIAQAAYQEVKETVKTIYTHNEYVDDTAIAGMGTTYTYRMKLQTGASRAKKIKFISVLENTEGAEWQGTFQSVDTSYAESKGFVPTVYYSESDTPSEDLTGAEWSTTAPENLENVKAIAVEFEGVQLDNSLLYFLVNMTAPDDDSLIGKKTENEYSVSFTSVDLVTEQETDSGTLKSNMVRVMLKDALGDAVITKTDATNGHKLSGATFDVYKVGYIQKPPMEMIRPDSANPGYTYSNGVYKSNTENVVNFYTALVSNVFTVDTETVLSFDYAIAGSATLGYYDVSEVLGIEDGQISYGESIESAEHEGTSISDEAALEYTPVTITLQPGMYEFYFDSYNNTIVDGESNCSYIRNVKLTSSVSGTAEELPLHDECSWDPTYFAFENGVYKSKNAEIAYSHAAIQTAEFTITNNNSFSFDYALGGGRLGYELINVSNGNNISNGEFEPSGQVADESELVYNHVSVDLEPGTYYCYFWYDLGSLSDNLDAAYIKNVCTESVLEELVGTVTTNATGTAILRNLEFGDYYLVETKAPNGYELNSDPVYFTVNQEGFEADTNSIKITVPNTRMKGTVVLTKTNSEDSTIPVQGATYGLYNSNGTLIYEGLVTNSNGQITVDELEWGSYYFLETERAQGYEINNDKVYFELDPDNVGEVVYVSTTDVQKPVSVILTKYDKPDTGSEITSTPVDGAIYALYKVDGENNTLVVSGLVTNSNGQIRVDNLLVGDYYFIETGKTVGYQLNDEKIYFSVTTEDAEVGLVTTSTYDIRIKGSVTLVKTNPDGDYVKDAVFTLFDGNDQIMYDDLVTGADGQIIVRDLQWGSYYFKEKSAPTGYELSDEKIEFEISRNNAETMQVVYAENTEKLSTVRLIKTSADDPTEYLQGAVFNLYRADGTEFATGLVTDSNGVIEVTNVPWGSYYFVETQAPSGFSLSSEKIRFSINYQSAGSTFEVYATNEHDTRQIDVTKRILASDINWANGDPTFLFTLSTTESSRYNNKYNAIISFDREYVLSHTDEDGYVEKTVSFTGLFADQYVLTEKETLRYEFADIRDVVNGTAFYGDSSHPVYGNCVAFDLDKSEYGAATFTNVKTDWSDASHTGNNTNIINVSRKLTALMAEINNNPVTHESSQDLDLTVYAVYDSGERELLGRDKYIIEDITFDLTQNGFYDVGVYYTERGKTVATNVIAEVSTDALFTYVIKDGKAIITGYLGNSDTVVFPKTIKEYEVAALGNGYRRISGMDNVTTIIISEGITQINYGAFYNCSSLSGSVVLPDSVTNIGAYAFYECSDITNLVIGENVGAINGCAFEKCSAITSITMPVSAYPANSTTFRGCTNVSSVTLTKGTGIVYNHTSFTCEYTPWYLSRNNSNGITVTIEDGITSIGNYTFSGCANLSGELIIPDSVETIGGYAFCKCSKLTSVTIGSNVTSIGNYAFYNCTGLTGELIIPDSVETIGGYAFGNCSDLTSATIGNGIESIDSSAFSGYSKLKVIRIDKPYNSVDGAPWGVLNSCVVIWNDSIIDVDTGLVYYEDNVYMIVTGLYDPDGTITSIEIPAVYRDKPVTVIDEGVFRGCSQLTSVTMGSNVTSIGDYAFFACTGLTGELVIPDSVETIGNYAFNGCKRFTSVTIGNSVETIGDYAFYNCNKLTSVTIGSNVTSIGECAFYNCTGLTGALVIPDSVETIGRHAFFGCGKLASVTIGSNVTSIGDYAFRKCTGLTGELVIPDSVETIGNYAFNGCIRFTSVTMGSNVTSIGNYAFYNCTGLTGELIIPDSVETIGGYAFGNCSDLTSATIGNGIESIDSSAFSGYSKLKVIRIDKPYNSVDGAPWGVLNSCVVIWNDSIIDVDTGLVYYEDNVYMIVTGLYDPDGTITSIEIPAIYREKPVTEIGTRAFGGHSQLTSVNIPESITSIGNSAFYNCASLTGELIIPDSVETIGSYAFYKCSKLTSVTIGSNVTSIGHHAFYNCTGLTGELVIPDNVETIDAYVFYSCSGITNLVIGENVGAISANAFKGCSGLTSITMPVSAYPTASTTFSGCTKVNSVTLTKGTETGYNYTSFTCGYTPWYLSRDNSNGITITIEDGVTSIGSYTFYNCTGLTGALVIPDSVETIGSSAFNGCGNLTSVTIGNGVTSIGSSAFTDCTGLTSVTIGSSVTSIGDYAFYGCSGLTGELVIPDSVIMIGQFTFQACSKLTSVTIGNGVTSIGNQAFAYCCDMTNLIIGESVGTIRAGAFYGCSELINITMPISAYPAASSTFNGCTNVSSVTLTKGTGTGYYYTTTTFRYTPWYYSRNNSNGVTVIIEDGVTSIGSYTFCDCSQLASVAILNPECSIYEDPSTIYSGATIKGYAGSTAESYATKYGRTFEAIIEEVQATLLTFPNKRFSKRPDEAE